MFRCAFRSPASWLSLLARSGILTLGLSFILRWAHHDEHWTYSKSVHDVLLSPILILCLLWFGAIGRAVEDHPAKPAEFIRALIHQLLSVPDSLGLWFVFGAALYGAGGEAYGTLIFPFACFAFCYRVSSFETDRVLAKLPKSDSTRGYSQVHHGYPPRHW